ARLVHPVEHQQVRTGLDLLERGGVARINLDGADRVRLTRVPRARLAGRPRRADAADEIKPGIEFLGQLDCDLAGAEAVWIGRHSRDSKMPSFSTPRAPKRNA